MSFFTFADIKKWALARLSPAQKTAGATWAVAHTPGGVLIGKDGETLGSGGLFPSITDDGTTVTIAPADVAGVYFFKVGAFDVFNGTGDGAGSGIAANATGIFFSVYDAIGGVPVNLGDLSVSSTTSSFTAVEAGNEGKILANPTLSKISVTDGTNTGSIEATSTSSTVKATDGTDTSTVTVTPTAVTIDTLATILPQVLAQTTDPAVAGQLWNSSGVVMISAG